MWHPLATVVLLLWHVVVAVQPKELEDWFSSDSGLAMSKAEADTLAQNGWGTLTQCGVTVKTLQALRDTMMDTRGLDLGLFRVRSQLLPLAKNHTSPAKLGQLYALLSGSYTLSGGLGFTKSTAQAFAVRMVVQAAEPDVLKALYQVLYGYSGLGFDQQTARQTAIAGAIAGVDAGKFGDEYQAAKAKGASAQAATQDAFRKGVAANLNGLVRRYAKNGQPYTASEFQAYYPAQWLDEWMAGPLEKRVSSDRLAYTASQFSRHFGATWASTFSNSPIATQVRLAEDSKPYTMQEFTQYYSNSWQAKWALSPELACKQCSPYLTGVAATSSGSASSLVV